MKIQKEIIPIIEPKDIIVGDPSAKVTLMEFGEYESDACAKANEAVVKLMEKYAGKIKFNFRHFPLTKIHQKAHKAAEAAIAASQEGKFWEMHQALFANRRNLGVISLKSYAKEIGVTNKRFLEELMDGVYGWNVQGDLMEGIKLGVKNVPTFFINNKLVESEPTFESLSRQIDLLLGGKEPVSIKPTKKRIA